MNCGGLFGPVWGRDILELIRGVGCFIDKGMSYFMVGDSARAVPQDFKLVLVDACQLGEAVTFGAEEPW